MATNQNLNLSFNEIHDFYTVQTYSSAMASQTSFHPSSSFKLPILPPFLIRKSVSELISTFLLVFVTCGAAALHRSDEKKVSQLAASAAGGLIVTVMVYSVGHISGAHMNPAVTLAFAVSKHGQFPWIQVPFYWLAQLSGAILASFVLKTLLYPIRDIGTTVPAGTPLQALIMEIVVSFCRMFVASAVATDSKAVGELAGVATGSAVCITSIFAGPISGGSMNPARSLGTALASKRFDSLWVYFLGPVLGMLSAIWSYDFIRLDVPEKLELASKLSSFEPQHIQSQKVVNVDV